MKHAHKWKKRHDVQVKVNFRKRTRQDNHFVQACAVEMHMDISQGIFCASRQTKLGGRNANPEPTRLGKICCASEKTCSPTLTAYRSKYAGKVWVIIQVATVWRKELGCTRYPLLNNHDNGKSPCRLMIFPFKPSICRGLPSQAWLITGGYPKLNRNWKPHIRWINKQKQRMNNLGDSGFTKRTSTNFGRSHRLPHTCTKLMYIRQNGKGTVWHNLQRGSRYFGQVPSLTSCLHNFKHKRLHVSYHITLL